MRVGKSHLLYCTCSWSLNGIRTIGSWRSGGRGVARQSNNILVQKTKEGIGGPLHKLEDNIKIDYTGRWWEVVNWVCVTHNRVRVLAVFKIGMNIRFL